MRVNLLNILFVLVVLNKSLTVYQKMIVCIFILVINAIYYNIDSNSLTSIYSKSKINKNFIIKVKTQNKNLLYFYESLRNFLKSKNWEELTIYDAKKENIIGFSVFGLNKRIVLKSQISYGMYTQQDNIFSNKIYLKEFFKNSNYFDDLLVLERDIYKNNIKKLIKFIKSKYNDSKYFIIKGLDYSHGKGLHLINVDDMKFKNINNIKNFLNELKTNIFIVDRYVEPKKFMVKEISLNHERINSESEFGRRSLIKFFIVTVIRNDILYIYKFNSFCIYLAVLPSFGSISKDIDNPGSYISNYFNSKNINSEYNEVKSDEKRMNIDTYRSLIYEEKYPDEIFSEIFCFGNNELKNSNSKDFKTLNMKVDNFINKFSEIYKDELVCKNSKCFNKEFNTCFNIFTVDCIFSEDNELKILDIDSNLSRMNLKPFKKNKNIFNIHDLFTGIFKMADNYDNLDNFSLISKVDRNKPDYIYFLSEQQSIMYPEMIRCLKERNFLRSIWRNPLNSSNNVDFYLGYIVKTDSISDDKEIYLDYLTFFLEDHMIINKVTGAIFDLGDKGDLYNILKGDVMIPEFVDFEINRGEKKDNYISTSKLLEIQNFISSNQSTCSRFILKPSLGSQGDGINVIKYYEQFVDWYKKESKYEGWTISEFLNPKLLKNKKLNDGVNRKAHIRSYFVLVRDKFGNLDIYELKVRLLYFAVDAYDESCVIMNSENKYSFITNLALASEERNVSYNTDNYTDLLSNYDDQIFNFKKLSERITEYGRRCIEKVGNDNLKCFNENYSKFEGCYQILAIDYLPINKNELKLLEVNKGPGFKGLKSNFDLKLIFDEIFSITIDRLIGSSREVELNFFEKIN